MYMFSFIGQGGRLDDATTLLTKNIRAGTDLLEHSIENEGRGREEKMEERGDG